MTTTNPDLQRAELLISQRRYDLAEEHARRAIGEDPNLAVAYAYLAVCLSEREAHTEATEAARRAVGLAPDDPYGHYVLALVLHSRNDARGALTSVEESLRLDPASPQAWGLLGAIHLSQKRWKDALSAADRGLQFDAEDEWCINIRAAALTGLGRREESGAAIDSTLARNPENALSHSNMGWTLLHRREPRKAMEHFREALRLDPTMESARAGIVEAMKARNFIYRWFLAYLLFMNRLGSRTQWAILIGGYLSYRLANMLAAGNHGLASAARVFTIAYFAFALVTILAYPVFNLLLCTSRFGRLALSREQRLAAVVLGAAMLPPFVFVAWHLATGSDRMLSAALVTAVFVIPVAITGLMRRGRDRLIMMAYTAVVAVVGAMLLAGVFGVRRPLPPPDSLIGPYALMGAISTWIGNALSTMRPPVKR